MLGLFFGQTDFPEKILKKIKQTKKPYFIIDLSKDKKFKMIKILINFQLVNLEK